MSRLRSRPLVILADDGLAQRAVPVALGHVGLAQRGYEALEVEDARTRVAAEELAWSGLGSGLRLGCGLGLLTLTLTLVRAEELAELAAVVAVRVVRILLVILF